MDEGVGGGDGDVGGGFGGVPTLFAMCFAMFLGALGAGQLPLCLTIPPARTRQVTLFAAGLLLGTALIIIMPEGLHMWLEALQHGDAHHQHHPHHDHDHAEEQGHAHAAQHTAHSTTAPTTELSQSHGHEHAGEGHAHLPHWQVGVAMAFGFVAMLVVEKISGGFGHGHSHQARSKEVLPTIGTSPMQQGSNRRHHQGRQAAASLSSLPLSSPSPSQPPPPPPQGHSVRGSRASTSGGSGNVSAPAPGTGVGPHGSTVNGSSSSVAGGITGGGGSSSEIRGGPSERRLDEEGPGAAAAAVAQHAARELDLEASGGGGGKGSGAGGVAPPPTAAFLGLLIHSAVDGIALGASCFAGGAETTAVIFLAIMLHKAPAALGLSVYLAQQGQKQRDVRRYLLIFSLAAPVGALVTFASMAVHIVSYQLYTLSLIMLFSGGTFLFVATSHILPELIHDAVPTWSEVALLCLGVVTPVFISVEHGH